MQHIPETSHYTKRQVHSLSRSQCISDIDILAVQKKREKAPTTH